MASCIKKTRRFLSVVKALISRSLFALHGLICIWRVTVIKHNIIFWALSGTLPFMVIETIFTLCKKKGGEWKWICPSVALYLATAIPAIWFLELDLMAQRLMIGVMRQPLQNASQNVFVLNGKMINLAISLGSEEWCKILEQMLLLILIVGRWLLPKGEITREQLSQLLLVYIGMAADIIELFEAFKEKTVRENYHLTIVILSLWTASLTQFTLVVTATKAKKTRPALDQSDNDNGCGCCPTEVISILISVFLQDAPFLVLRMLLIFRYDVLSYTNIFFTCKNTLVLTLQIYRLIVLFTSKPPETEAEGSAPATIRYQSSTDTLDALYASSGSLSDTSASERPRKLNKKRQRYLRQLTADSSKTVSSSVDAGDTTHSLENECRASKGPSSKHRRKASLVTKATKHDSDSSSLKSPNRNLEKSSAKRAMKDRVTSEEAKDISKTREVSESGNKKRGDRQKKAGKTQQDKSKDGEVKRKVKKFERQSEIPPSVQQTSDSDLTDDAILEDVTPDDLDYRRYRIKEKLKTFAKDPSMMSASPKSEHQRRYDNPYNDGRPDTPLEGVHEHRWESVRDLRTALSFLNQTGKFKTVVVKNSDQGQTMYIVDDSEGDNYRDP